MRTFKDFLLGVLVTITIPVWIPAMFVAGTFWLLVSIGKRVRK